MITLFAVSLNCLTVGAQAIFEEIYATGTFRGVALNDFSGHLYLSSYDTNQVLEVDLATREVRRKVTVGAGPTALVLSRDGYTLACINRASGTLSVMDTRQFTLLYEVDCGVGAVVVTALPGGGFAVANSFSDTVTLVPSSPGSTPTTIEGNGSVLNGIAAGDFYLAVTTRAPAGVFFYDLRTQSHAGRVELDDAPAGVAALSNGRFAVLGKSRLYVLDAASRRVVREAPQGGSAILVTGDKLHILSADRIAVFDSDLTPLETLVTPAGTRIAGSVAGVMAAVVPSENRAYVRGPWSADLARAPVAAPVRDVPVASTDPESPVLPVVEQEPLPEEVARSAEPEPEAPVAAEAVPPRVETSRAQPIEPALAPEGVPGAETAPIETEAARPARVLSEAELFRKEIYSRLPENVGVRGYRPRAPHFRGERGLSFMDRVAEAMSLSEGESSLLALDWGDRLKNIEFGGEASLRGDRLAVDGGVKFDVGDALVLTEELERDQSTGEIRLEGDVSISRGTSILTADSLHYQRPDIELLQTVSPLVPHTRRVGRSHPLVPRGYEEKAPFLGPGVGLLSAEAVHLDEAGRLIDASSLTLDLGDGTGELLETSGHAGPLYFSARTLRILGPADLEGREVWVTTCDRPVPHYKIRMKRVELRQGHAYTASLARLQIGKITTPIFIPLITGSTSGQGRRLGLDLHVGSRANLGQTLDIAQWFRVTDTLNLAPRLYLTTSQGTGFGVDGEYDFMDDPTSPLFRSQGSFQTLYTTEDRGYTQAYHRQELTTDTVLLAQWEQWYDKDFVKDFYNEDFNNRTAPRTFVNVTHTRPQYIASASVSKITDDFSTGTEKLPELTFHLLERSLGHGFYGSFDGAAGYYTSKPGGYDSARLSTVGRLSYDWRVVKGLNVVPFVEADGTWYSNALNGRDSSLRGNAVVGTTVQTRFQRAYSGRRGFSGFKHIVVPSMTVSYRPDDSLDEVDTPIFDDLDDRPGRTRVETTLDNVLLGRNAETGVTWPVARFTLYQGNDLTSEVARKQDYEVVTEIRPRPWWGFQTLAEIHSANSTALLPEEDSDRVLSFVFFDDRYGKNKKNARLGFALTKGEAGVLNREILYGFGYRLSKNWSFAFEQRYDLEQNGLVRQSYELRRRLHMWEMGIRVRDRSSGIDVGVEFNLTDFPGTTLGF